MLSAHSEVGFTPAHCDINLSAAATMAASREPAWPSGRALFYRLASRRTSVRFRFGSPQSVLKSCGLWSLACDFDLYIATLSPPE